MAFHAFSLPFVVVVAIIVVVGAVVVSVDNGRLKVSLMLVLER